MKKMKFMLITLLMSIGLMFVSCDNTNKLVEEDGRYYVYVENNKTDTPIKLSISSEIIDMGVPENEIVSIASTTVRYADWGAKHKMTYELIPDVTNFITVDTIKIKIKGADEETKKYKDSIIQSSNGWDLDSYLDSSLELYDKYGRDGCDSIFQIVLSNEEKIENYENRPEQFMDKIIIKSFISGSAENSYGVRDKITTVIKFDKHNNGHYDIMKNENGTLDIISF